MFDLLTDIGGDCVGALQIHSPTATPPDVRRITARRSLTCSRCIRSSRTERWPDKN